MTTHAHTQNEVAQSASKSIIGGASFDGIFLLAALWFVSGGYADTWAHSHFSVFESFFTPWHAVLYSGFLVTMLVLLTAIFMNRARGFHWSASVPAGYGLSVVGMIGFALGGIGDALWHTFFGFEQGTDAQYSPTHVILIIAGILFVSGPYRALYRRAEGDKKVGQWLLLSAVTIFYAWLMLVSQDTHPLLKLWTMIPKANSLGQYSAITGFLIQTAIFNGLMLYTIRRWKLLPGFFTILLTVNAIPLSFMFDYHIMILIGFLAGVLTDGVYLVLRPSAERLFEFRLFAAIAPALLYLVYFLVMEVLGDVVWSIHLTAGTVVFTAFVGWAISYLVVPGRGLETFQAQ